MKFDLLRKLTWVTLGFWGPLVVFVVLANEVLEGGSIGLDGRIMQSVHGLTTPSLDAWAVGVTQTGSALMVIATTLAIATMLATRRHFAQMSFVLFAVGGASVVNLCLKLVFQRARPELWEALVTEHSYSFPSGHAMGSATLALSLMVLAWKTRWRWTAIIIAGAYLVLVGLTRVYLGVHYPTDVVAGWCISLAWVAVVYAIFKRHWSV